MLPAIDVERYRREAEKCRRTAGGAVDRLVREQWLALAAEYDVLVESAELLNRRRRPPAPGENDPA